MESRLNFLVACGLPIVFALPHGVKMTALGLGEGIRSSRLWIGLPLLMVGIVALEWCFSRGIALMQSETQQIANSGESANASSSTDPELFGICLLLYLVSVGLVQFLSVFQFILLLDMHVHLYAACYLYLVYLLGLVVLLPRWKVWTRWELTYIRCGWAPILAFGIPLSLPYLKAAALVPGIR